MKPPFIILGALAIIVLLAVGVLTGLLPGLREGEPDPFTLTVWGLDPPAAWEAIAASYREAGPTATVTYVAKDPATYEAELLNALAAGGGPDVLFVKDEWLGRHGDKLRRLADGEDGYRRRDFRATFADGLLGAIVDAEGALLGVPLGMDTLALFYNRDYFNSAGIPAPPATWEEFAEYARRLTRRSAVGGIERSGVAVGTAANVEHAADIFTALIYQSGGAILDAAGRSSALRSQAATEALAFYTSFAAPTRKTYAWNAFFERSLTAFANGDTAMAFGYASDVAGIAAKNPQLNFDVAPLPQPARPKAEITLGRFTVLAVARTSREARQAWRFIRWFSEREQQQFYAEAVGLPSARRDLTGLKPPREYLQPFYDQVLTARAVPVAPGGSIGAIVNDMIDAVANRRFSVDQAISQAETNISALFEKQP